jgi:hypothetical protein
MTLIHCEVEEGTAIMAWSVFSAIHTTLEVPMKLSLLFALCLIARSAQAEEPIGGAEESALRSEVMAGPAKLCGKAGTCRKWNGIKCENKSFFAVCAMLCKSQADFAGSQCGLKAKKALGYDFQTGRFRDGAKASQYVATQAAAGGLAASVGCEIIRSEAKWELYFGKTLPADVKADLDKLANVCHKDSPPKK